MNPELFSQILYENNKIKTITFSQVGCEVINLELMELDLKYSEKRPAYLRKSEYFLRKFFIYNFQVNGAFSHLSYRDESKLN